MEDCKAAVVEVSAMDRESEALETELANVVNLLDSLATRLAPVIRPSPQEEAKEVPAQAMSPLCCRLNGWTGRVTNACRCINKLIQELEV